MNLRTRLLVFTLVLLLVPGLLAAQQPPGSPVPNEILKPVQERFAPDKRLAVFDVTIERTTQGLVVKGDVEQAEVRDAIGQALGAAGLGPVTNSVTVLPDPALGSKHFGIVRVSVANVRGRPSHAAEMVTQSVMGWTVRVLRQQSGWYYVHTDPDGYLGWIEELQLALVDQAGRDAWQTGPRAIVTAVTALITEQPSSASVPVSDVVAGSLLRAGGDENGWTKVVLGDGRQGYVSSSGVEMFDAWTKSRQPTPDNIERTAQRFMGVPYLWGGTSSKGFDCSGYAKTVLRLNGIELPRDTDQQSALGTGVTVDDQLTQLRKGDLVFFGTKATAERPERVTHVGIYVGNGEVLHASGLVRRNSLLATSAIYSESLRNRLLSVRRVLP